jgi:hypothetical protein
MSRLAGRTILLLALLLAGARPQSQAPSSLDLAWRSLRDGVEHAHIARNAARGGAPAGNWNIHALRVDVSRARLDVVRAMDAAIGLETTSAMAERYDAIAAVNGGYFRTTGTLRGDSTGTVQIDGVLLSEPDRGRAAVGILRPPAPASRAPATEPRGGATAAATRLVFGHVTWEASIQIGGQRRPLDGINRARGSDEVVVYTPAFHRTTLTGSNGIEVVVRNGQVTGSRDNAGSTPIPEDGMVISASGSAAAWARSAVKRGSQVRVSQRLLPADPSPAHPWASAEDVLAAGPKLVTGGRVDVTDQREKMLPNFATDLHPRTAIGTLRDGRALLLVVDGRQPGFSDGMSLDELARLLIELGAHEAINLDGGGSTTMVIEGKVVNRPSDPTGERPVSDAIVVRR